MMKEVWLTFGCLLSSAASAQTGAEYYAGKSVELYAGSSAGAGYDLYARLLARHLGRHLSGSTSVVVKNMDGAGGVRLATWLLKAGPQDGLAIGTFGRGIAFDKLFNASHAAAVDGRQFGWIGSMNNEVSVCVAWHTSGVTRFEDLMTRDLTVGATGAGGDTLIFSQVLNTVLGTHLKIVNGYPGGNEISLALERGEVQGRCGWSWSSLKATHQNWVDQRQMYVLAQLGLSKHLDLPNVPLELDFATTQEQRDELRLVFGRQAMSWPFAVPGSVPPERIAYLRRAFNETMIDPEFLKESEKGGFEIRTVRGEEIDRILVEAYGMPPDITGRIATLFE